MTPDTSPIAPSRRSPTTRETSKRTGWTVRRFARLIGRDEQGGALIYVAMLTPILVAIGGLAIDVGVWYSSRRDAQVFVDSAAVAAALEMRRSEGNLADMETAAEASAAMSGYDSSNGDTIDIYWPPQSGPFAGDNSYVEAVATTPGNSFLARNFAPDSFTIQARAVAMSRIVEACVFALHPSGRAAMKVTGGAQVNLNCGVFVNSYDSEALTNEGSSCLNATVVGVVGSYTGDCINPTPADGLNQIVDPLSHIDGPAYGGCDVSSNINLNSGDVMNLSPGVYCGNISVQGTAQLNLVPNSDDDNVFVFNNMALSIGASATMTGDEVFIYFTENQNNPSENWTIAGGADVTLSAADSGPWASYIFYHDRNAGDAVFHSLAGGANQTIDGIIYTPTMDLAYAGTSTLNGGTSMLIADEIQFVGDTDIGGFSGSIVANNEDLYGATLVE